MSHVQKAAAAQPASAGAPTSPAAPQLEHLRWSEHIRLPDQPRWLVLAWGPDLLQPGQFPAGQSRLALSAEAKFLLPLYPFVICLPAEAAGQKAFWLAHGACDVLTADELPLLSLSCFRVQQWQRMMTFSSQQLQTHSPAAEELLLLQGIQASGIAPWCWDFSTQKLRRSKDMAVLFGRTLADFPDCDGMTNEEYLNLIYPPDREEFMQRVMFTLANQRLLLAEHRIVYPDGSVHWLLSRANIVNTPQGQPLQLRGITVNIDQRKQAEHALIDSESQFRQFMDNGPCVSFIKLRDGRDPYVNRLFRELLIHNADAEGKSDYEIYPHDIAKKLREQDLRIWEKNETWYGIEQVPLSSGEIRSWWVVKFLFHDKFGVQSLGGMALDMTDRLESEEKNRTLSEELCACVTPGDDGAIGIGIGT